MRFVVTLIEFLHQTTQRHASISRFAVKEVAGLDTMTKAGLLAVLGNVNLSVRIAHVGENDYGWLTINY